MLNLREMLVGTIRRPSYVLRYSSIPTIRQEYLGEHMYYASLYSYLIATEFINKGYDIDMGKLLSESLLHDVEESVTGDVLRIVKHSDPILLDILKRIGSEAMKSISEDLGLDVFSAWSDAKGQNPEGTILKVADLLTVIAYLMEELQKGNTLVNPVVREVSMHINKVLDHRDDYVLPEALDYLEDGLKMLQERSYE